MTTDATTIGARATVGWSWRIGRRVFISAAVGASAGHRHGNVTTESGDIGSAMTREVALPDTEVAPEGFVRIGILGGASPD